MQQLSSQHNQKTKTNQQYLFFYLGSRQNSPNNSKTHNRNTSLPETIDIRPELSPKHKLTSACPPVNKLHNMRHIMKNIKKYISYPQPQRKQQGKNAYSANVSPDQHPHHHEWPQGGYSGVNYFRSKRLLVTCSMQTNDITDNFGKQSYAKVSKHHKEEELEEIQNHMRKKEKLVRFFQKRAGDFCGNYVFETEKNKLGRQRVVLNNRRKRNCFQMCINNQRNKQNNDSYQFFL